MDTQSVSIYLLAYLLPLIGILWLSAPELLVEGLSLTWINPPDADQRRRWYVGIFLSMVFAPITYYLGLSFVSIVSACVYLMFSWFISPRLNL